MSDPIYCRSRNELIAVLSHAGASDSECESFADIFDLNDGIEILTEDGETVTFVKGVHPAISSQPCRVSGHYVEREAR